MQYKLNSLDEYYIIIIKCKQIAIHHSISNQNRTDIPQNYLSIDYYITV